MKAFITGGAGFIGSRLAMHLLAAGAGVTVYDNFHPQAHANNPENRAKLTGTAITVIEGDVRDADALQQALRQSGADVVYHLAAETGTGQSFDLPARYTDVNVMGTAHLIEAMRAVGGIRRVILAGSRSVYGEGACLDGNGRLTPAAERTVADLTAKDFVPKDAQGHPLTPCPTNADCVVAPASVYASTKLMQEYLLRQAFWGTDVEVGILRLQNVYGPGQSLNNPYTGVLSIFCRQIQEGRVLNIFEDGEITRDFVLVDDVVRAFAMMGHSAQMPRGVIDIGSGEAATILHVARRLLAMLGESPDKLVITGAFRPGDIRYAVADISAAQKALGWLPLVDLEQGLQRLVNWSRETMKAQG
jgi:dTDP-L-rhamnose 4-epimerase